MKPPDWVWPAIDAVILSSPAWADWTGPLHVKWLKGRPKTRLAYYNARTHTIGIYFQTHRPELLLAHELAHLIEPKHTKRHYRLTVKAAKVIAKVTGRPARLREIHTHFYPDKPS